MTDKTVPEGMETTEEVRKRWADYSTQYEGLYTWPNSVVRRLCSDLDRALAEIARLTAALAEAEAAIEKAVHITLAGAASREQRARKEEREAASHFWDETLTLARIRIMDLEEGIARLTAELEASDARYQDCYDSRKALTARIAELEAERLILHDKCNEANRELGGLRIDYVRLEAERDAAKKGRQFVLETMQAENDGLREVNDLLRAERDRLKEERRRFFAKLTDLHDVPPEHFTEPLLFHRGWELAIRRIRAALSDPSGE